MDKYDIPFAAKVSNEGARKIWNEMNVWVFRYSVRQAKAAVLDKVNTNLGIPEEPATLKQKDALAKFGYSVGYLAMLSKGLAHALLSDIHESLNFDVARYEKLFEADEVIHIERPEEVTEIATVEACGMARLKRSQGTFNLRMLRRHRPDGNYSNTAIPEHYFANGWLRRAA